MAVFSLIKRGRQQAKEHSAKQADKAQQEAAKTPYKHVPTHAAIDSISGAPASWQHEIRPRIQEENRRRSAMVTSSASSRSVPRVGSSLSNVSYPPISYNPVVSLPKNYSRNSLPGDWHERRSINYSQVDYFGDVGSIKGKERAVVSSLPPKTSVHAQAKPPQHMSVEKAEPHMASSGSSSSSEEDLEMRPARTISYRSSTATDETKPRHLQQTPANTPGLHRLHPSYQRRLSGQHEQTQPSTPRNTRFTAPRPMNPQALTAAQSIPPVPLLPTAYKNLARPSAPSSGPPSVASSTVSGLSTTPSSVHSTPVATPFPSSDKLSSMPKDKDSSERMMKPKATRFTEATSPVRHNVKIIPSVQITPTRTIEDATSPLPRTVERSISELEPVVPGKSSRKLVKRQELKPANDHKKRRWSFRTGKQADAVAA
ncbi:hypothetical protein JX265_011069 [Neoarthrinium moseri]|uniref:Uncharacterized protein n=1 Tax=Neoarthrinium moseri TaxID=1658444 RepID=A0A9Q0AJY9_9PEZI|nr:hypothetical protein JX265_011069 [Neoarthrinium moseri]